MQQKTPRERMMTPSSPSPTWLAQVGEQDRRGKGHLLRLAAVLVLLAAAAVTAAGLYGKNQEENAGRTQEAGTAKT